MVSDPLQSEPLDVVVNVLTTTDMSTLGLLGIVSYFLNETYYYTFGLLYLSIYATRVTRPCCDR